MLSQHAQTTRATLFYLIFCISALKCLGQCPWSGDFDDLHSDCACAYNNVQRLSIQCSPVNFTRLLEALHANVESTPIDLLYINNSTIETLPEACFKGMDIHHLHISKSKLSTLPSNAFDGLTDKLQRLSLPDNRIAEIPVGALSRLSGLRILDLSVNNISRVPANAFSSNQLNTLKLADNRLENISKNAFSGLEPYLKHLNLKGTELTRIPEAIENLTELAFLDLAQNKLQILQPNQFANLQTLTALSLERNKIKDINSNAFLGVNDSLSSLSLLNNLIKDFPSQAISSLTELRVSPNLINIVATMKYGGRGLLFRYKPTPPLIRY